MGNNNPVSVLFVCTGNSCRSQMAEGLLRHLAGDKVKVMSAGSHPAVKVSPYAVDVMHEIGIDISKHYPKSFRDVADEKFDWVITLCDYAKTECPVFYSKDGTAKRLHWSIKDPHCDFGDKDEALKVYREARDEIKKRIDSWLKEQGLI